MHNLASLLTLYFHVNYCIEEALTAAKMATWALTEQERLDVVERLTLNMCNLAFFRNAAIPGNLAATAAIQIEQKAYTAAQVASNTTTGSRPKAETTSAYARRVRPVACSVVHCNLMAPILLLQLAPQFCWVTNRNGMKKM